jgi:hypothetical protein
MKVRLPFGKKMHPRADVVGLNCDVKFCCHFLEGRATT